MDRMTDGAEIGKELIEFGGALADLGFEGVARVLEVADLEEVADAEEDFGGVEGL